MHYLDFINKYQGKKVDYDGAYGAQCVDLFRFYCKEVLGIGQPRGVNGAKDFWGNYDTDPALYKNFDKIPNTPDFVPQPGDVWIWTANYGKYGHIAITSYGKQTTSQFECFSQNDPINSPCVLKTYKYSKIYGVLRPKDQTNIRLNNNEAESEAKVKLLEFLDREDVDDAIRDLTTHLGSIDNKCDWGNDNNDRGGYLGDERRKTYKLESDLKQKDEKIAKLESEATHKDAKIKQLEEELDRIKTEQQNNKNNEDGLASQLKDILKKWLS